MSNARDEPVAEKLESRDTFSYVYELNVDWPKPVLNVVGGRLYIEVSHALDDRELAEMDRQLAEVGYRRV